MISNLIPNPDSFTYREDLRVNFQSNAHYHGMSCKCESEVLGSRKVAGTFGGGGVS